jgi:hypothetical protein
VLKEMSRYEIRGFGALLLLMSLLIVLSWMGLIIHYDYPDILRAPINVILHKYHEGGLTLRMYWAGMVVSSLLIIPIVLLFSRLTSQINPSLSLAAVGVGLASAIFHLAGFSRWLFAVDYLAMQYVGHDSPATDTQREAIEILFQTLHWYLGVTLGETLGFATMGVWAILIAVSLYRAGYLNVWLLVLSIGSGIGIMAGILEWAGLSIAAAINAYAYQLWILIIAYIGFSFLLKRKHP